MAGKPVWPPRIRTRDGVAYIRVVADGRRTQFTLGPAGSPVARQEYLRLVAEMEAHGNKPPPERSPDMTCMEAIDAYLETRDGRDEQRTLARRTKALDAVGKFYGHTTLRQFKSLAVKTVRAKLAPGLSRRYLNALVQCIRAWVKWCVAEELCGQEQLDLVKMLAPDKDAPELPPREPANMDAVNAALKVLPWPLKDMVNLQLYTGMRPGEVCALTPGMIEKGWLVDGVEVWVAHFGKEHKTAWRGHRRDLVIGPKGQGLLQSYMGREPDAAIFSPLEAKRRAARTRSKNPFGVRKDRRKKEAKFRVGSQYTTSAYDKAIKRCLRDNGLELWTPHQLRHRVGTDLYAAGGDGAEEDAQAVLGHESLDATRIYLKKLERAARIIAKIG